MKSAHLHPVEEPVPPLEAAPQPLPPVVFVILRKVVRSWNTTAKVVAAHVDISEARADLASFRTYEPNHDFAIFRLVPEEPDA
jgi:hypothetical protein